MDHYQACRNSKGSTKKKKVHSVLNLAGSPTSHDICSVGAEAVQKSPEQCLASQSVSSAQSVTATGSEVVESGEGATKRKRNRKKKNKLHSINKNTPESENIKDQSDSIADISASLIPAVQEAIRLLKASEEQMVGSQQSASSNTTNQKSSKIGGKEEHSKTSAAEVVTVVSPGASRLTGLQSASSLAVNVSNHNAPLCGIESNVLNLKDLEFLKSASSLGPIYSRSPFSSSVTVTSSSLSNQLTSERICSSNLFSGAVRSSVSEIASPTDKMSAPQVSEKSRAEIEEERKKRKAAKAEKKGKPKGNAQGESGTKPVVKEGPTKPSTSAQPSKSVDRKEMGHKDSVNTLDDSLRQMHLAEPILSHRLGKDEPDFARSNLLPEAGVLSSELPKRFQHISTELEIKEKGDKDKKDSSEKSKAELRAERRLKQETQRLAKAQQQQEKQKLQQDALKKPNEPQKKLPEKLKNRAKDQGKTPQEAKAERRVKLFSHLHQNSFKNISQTIGVSHPQYHMSIVRLGVQYSNRVILGSNARCLALLYTLKDLIEDYETPPQKEFSRGLEAYLQPNMDFLQQCRPHSVSMVNALRYIKWQLTQLSIEATDAEARQHILEAIDQYISDQIGKAAEAIGEVVKDKIDDNDVILVYACSSLVLSALKSALETKRKFHVIVVDSLPWLEGREMLRRLVSMGVQCSYVHLSAASFVMRQVSKVLLGAHALLANGYVMSRAGTAQVALLAHAYNVPVLVCCETYKFSERVQTDSIVYNELADPDELIGSRRAGERETERERPLANWRDIPSLSLLNLVYDVTPPELVTAVVTERAILPCTSVPVILRIKPTEC